MIAEQKNKLQIIDYGNDKDNQIAYQSTKIQIPTCSCCFSLDEVKGFICNHNLCLKCLVYTGIQQIHDYFQLIKLEKTAAYFQFFYVCPVYNCSGIIQIPCSLILRKLDYFIERNDEKFLNFKDYKERDAETWSKWIPYFDGIGFESE